MDGLAPLMSDSLKSAKYKVLIFFQSHISIFITEFWIHSFILHWNLHLSFCRYPNPFLQQPPPSPLETQLKSQLPGGLGHDPRLWHREDVSVFLRYCEREFDLEQIDLEKFQMNGKYFLFIYLFSFILFSCFHL